MSRRLGFVACLLFLLTIIVTYPQASLQDWTGTEGRRVQITAEMERSGDLLLPTLSGQPIYTKPPLHYWLLYGSRAVFGDSFYAARVPSIAMVFALSLLAFVLHRRTFGLGAAWVASLGIVCSPLVVMQFASAEIDPPFACLTAASLFLLAYGAGHSSRGAMLCAGVLGGLAVLAKGPPYLLFASGAWLVFFRHRGGRGFFFYFVPLVLPSLSYYAALLFLNQNASEVGATANEETIGRLMSWQWQSIVDLPVFWLRAFAIQLPLVCWCFWEWRSARDARMNPADLMLRMCSGAALFAVILLSFFPSRPTRYLLPNIPLFVFAVAPAVSHYARQGAALGRFAKGVLAALGLIGAGLLVATPLLALPLPGRMPAFALAASLVPFLVHTRRALVACCLWLPAVAAYTINADRADHWLISHRARAVHGPLLRREIAALDAMVDIQTVGHIHGGLLLGAGLLPRGDEWQRQPPTSKFVLYQSGVPFVQGYDERFRLCLSGQDFIVAERHEK